MFLKRGSVLGVFVLGLVLSGATEAQAQGNGNVPRGNPRATTSLIDDGSTAVKAQIAALHAELDQALATIAQLQTALTAEISARQAGDTTLANSIGAISGGGVTMAAVEAAVGAAVAAEATTRAAADGALQGSLDNEKAARAAADTSLQGGLDALAPVMTLAPLATYVTIASGAMDGLPGPHVIFNGANVHIRNGAADSFAHNGLGNLIVGYNESAGYSPSERGGSHNVVVGPYHRYNFGVGLVVGLNNRLGGDAASVGGGMNNNAGADLASVSAGSNNQATGVAASVSGGDSNTASGSNASVSAGFMNQATGDLSSVSGGYNNAATGSYSTVGGGSNLTNGTGLTFIP